ncbi:MAG: 4Fe-4S binding protein [Clostridia bacterium]|nr:4Fe-4S binding protein [Clostridia bacterium]
MAEFFHSVRLDRDKCRGCTNCIKRCPTGAIRVRGGKAHIIKERCIDCGECINVCPHHAKYAEHEPLEIINNFKYKIALPAPALYGQFNNLDEVDYVLTAFKKIGFDDVFEVSKGAELVSDATRKLFSQGQIKTPAISSACPAIVRLIRVNFPNLIDHVVPLNSPMEIAAKLAREKAKQETGLEDKDIGVFFITPCPAKMTAIKSPVCLDGSQVNGAFAIKEIYPLLLTQMNRLENVESLQDSGRIGVSWASSGGEVSALLRDNCLAADGIENVIKILNEIEDEKLEDIDFIELNACTGGCVGGSLTYENPYVAKARMKRLRKYLPVACTRLETDEVPDDMYWTRSLLATDVMKLADSVPEAMKKMAEKQAILKRLPGLDCGTCGAPSCTALADDIVRGFAAETDCVFRLRDKLSGTERELIPAPYRAEEESNNQGE